jgi:beta-glucanase (GH16 family)
MHHHWTRCARAGRGLAVPAALIALAACADAALAPDPTTAHPSSAVAFADGFDALDPARWTFGSHPLGRGSVLAGNAALGGGAATLHLAAGAFDGAELRSVEKHRFGAYTARMKTPRAPGTVSAFFLYEGGSDIADELDVELFNDGSRRIMFTTWVAGKETNNVILPLPFDPADAFHDYRIEWSRREVRFLVDGVLMQSWRRGIPQNPMYLMANTWWPVWLTGPLLDTPAPLVIDEIRAGA